MAVGAHLLVLGGHVTVGIDASGAGRTAAAACGLPCGLVSTAPPVGGSGPSAVQLLVLDVDGVLTDGAVLLLPDGQEGRSVHFHDLDAAGGWRRRGLRLAILSGEDTPGVRLVAGRFGIDDAVFGAKDKLRGLQDLAGRLGTPLEQTCYIGDADRDAPALEAAGIGLAPCDATAVAQAAADHVLATRGGRGVVVEAVALIDRLGQRPGSDPP
jgi:3-deoxy-D-manno-octulosonate 8-phosphate phosphatase (KDO 8-P phosphatase)